MLIDSPSYRLRRMVLINVGTNKNKPSGRITAVDPRGGAAVLGENGVGKTTTLRLLPLFFGHLHSAIVDPQKGQQNMVRFVLPTDMSAIAFEYQRGSDNELRLAVLRRRADDPDSLCYRIFRCGYRRELFVHEGRFLGEEETQKAAIELGIQAYKRLTPSDYRHVILGTPAETKEKVALRSISQDFSFGPRPLANLDRVVAAMVKKSVNFSDIIQVAVSLAQSELGAGGSRGVLSYKQGKSQIEQWVRDRQACKDALKLQPQVSALHDSLGDFRRLEATIRACRGDIEALHLIRSQEVERLGRTLADSKADRQSALTAEQLALAGLESAVKTASDAATVAQEAFKEQQDLAHYFRDHDAPGCEIKLTGLGQLESNLALKNSQLEAHKQSHANLIAHFQNLEHGARTRAADHSFRLEQSKGPLNDRLVQGLGKVSLNEKHQLKDLDDEIEGLRQTLDELKGNLQSTRGEWIARKKSPAASAEAIALLTAADDDLRQHYSAIASAQRALVPLANAVHQAKVEFDLQEGFLQQARQQLTQARDSLAQAQQMLAPADGTLLSALRSSEDQTWRTHLARVIDPRLLGHTELTPHLAEEGASSLYGWSLNTAALPAPDWADDESARQAIAECQDRVVRAEASVKAQEAALKQAEGVRRAAESAHQTDEGLLNAKNARTEDLVGRQSSASQRVQKERDASQSQASTEITRLDREISEIDQKLNRLKGDRAHRANAINRAKASVMRWSVGRDSCKIRRKAVKYLI